LITFQHLHLFLGPSDARKNKTRECIRAMTKSGLNWICPMTLFFINLVCYQDQVVEIFTNVPMSPRSSNLESRVKKMTKILKHQYMRKIIIFIDDPLGIYASLVQCFFAESCREPHNYPTSTKYLEESVLKLY
jgi:hypothetical protein